MRWTTKARALRAFSTIPGGRTAHYALQRHVTRSLRPGRTDATTARRRAAAHLAAWERFGDRPTSAISTFEFGAGWHLGAALSLAAAGVTRQVVTDLEPLVRRPLVFEMATALASVPGPPVPQPRPDESVDDFLARTGITYRAPVDAAATGLPTASVDLVVSAHVLEHVDVDAVPAIVRECRRLLRPGGVMSFEINYQDHYSGVDRSISRFNFLRYDDVEWERFDPPLHRQNRLRHHEYVEAFRREGLEILDTTVTVSDDDRELVSRLPLAPRFAAMPVDDLAVRMARFVIALPRT